MMAGKITAPYLISSIILVQRTRYAEPAKLCYTMHLLMLFSTRVMGKSSFNSSFSELYALICCNMYPLLFLEKHKFQMPPIKAPIRASIGLKSLFCIFKEIVLLILQIILHLCKWVLTHFDAQKETIKKKAAYVQSLSLILFHFKECILNCSFARN